jgi:hypothetical protein
MIFILSFSLLLSVIFNITLIWYTRKLIKNLNIGIINIDQFQELLNEYASLLESMLTLDQFYGDDTITAAVKNTKMVIEASKFYKNSILEIEDDSIDKSEKQNG